MLPNVVLFAGKDSTSTASLWVTDGTASGTFELLTSPPAIAGQPPITGEAIFGFVPQPGMPLYLTVFNDQVLFWGRYSPNPAAPIAKGPYTLWTTDGTAAGTVPIPLTSIAGANPNGLFIGNDNSGDVTPGFTVFGDAVLFRGIDSAGKDGLWKTDGTAAGTKEIAEITGAALTGVNPTDITVFNGVTLFNGNGSDGLDSLWKTDGKLPGIGTSEITGIVGAAAGGLNPTDMTVFGDHVLFNGGDANGLSGLWVTDGSGGSGTYELTGILGAAPSGLDPTDMTVFGDEVLFNGVDANGLSGLWVTDGTAKGTRELLADAAPPTGNDPHGLDPGNFTVFNGEVYFTGLDQYGRGFLWVTDGTDGTAPGAFGTKEIVPKSGFPPSGGLNPSNLEVYNGQILFSGHDSTGPQDLWTTDGTAAGTKQITGISGEWSNGLFPTGLTALTPGEAAATTIAGTVSGQTTTSETPVKPFAHVTIGDANAGATDTLTITLRGAGGSLADGTGFSSLTTVGAGVYRLSGNAASITSELDALVFTPTAGAPNTTSTTTFTLSDLSSANSAPVVDSTTSVIDSDPAVAPTIAGTASGQTTTSETPVKPFAHVTIDDANAGATDTLTITLGGAGGSLADGTGFSSLTTVGAGVYRLSGTTAAITSELDAFIFTPTAGAPNTTSTTTFTLSDLSSGFGAPTTDGATSVIDSDPAVASTISGAPTHAASDFTGIGTSDVLLQNGGTVVDWIMNNGVYQSGNVLTTAATGWNVVGTGHFTGSGVSDPLLQNGGTVVDWIMNNGVYQSGNVLTTAAAGWDVVGTGDFTGSGTDDVLLQNGGSVVDWIMHNGAYQSGNVLTTAAAGWNVVGTGDFTGNGTDDVVLQNGGTVVDWIMKNGAYESGNVLTTGAAGWKVVGAGDFSGNGTDDVLLQNGGTVVDWVMQNGKYVSGNVISSNAAGFNVVGTGDYNGDGTSDILLQNGGAVVDWIMKDGHFASGNVLTTAASGWHVAHT